MTPSHRIGDPARNLANLLAQSVEEDVDALDFLEPGPDCRDLVVTRDGVDFLVQVRPMSEVDS